MLPLSKQLPACNSCRAMLSFFYSTSVSAATPLWLCGQRSLSILYPRAGHPGRVPVVVIIMIIIKTQVPAT